ncbi:hypothetical protein RBSH_01372 [Rhodopirellula baltica SH28]|uniref:Uncharacterized protein n=1 Tax=Rhodopirellula baltica SH28 TaxID=993517 RepID=K5DKC4_RHOBT|nr:hypothetical protein RBSH_01372 [Rhodopirellula baltica SH28]
MAITTRSSTSVKPVRDLERFDIKQVSDSEQENNKKVLKSDKERRWAALSVSVRRTETQ